MQCSVQILACRSCGHFLIEFSDTLLQVSPDAVLASTPAVPIDLMTLRGVEGTHSSATCEPLCAGKVCVIDISSSTAAALSCGALSRDSDHMLDSNITAAQKYITIIEVLAKRISEKGGRGCLFILPPEVTPSDIEPPGENEFPTGLFIGCISAIDGNRVMQLIEVTEPCALPRDNVHLEEVRDSARAVPRIAGDIAESTSPSLFTGVESHYTEGARVVEKADSQNISLPHSMAAHFVSVRRDPLREKLLDIASYKPAAMLIVRDSVEPISLPPELKEGECPIAVVAHTDAKSIKAAVAGGDGPGSISLPADNGTSCNTQACDEHPTVPTMRRYPVEVTLQFDTEEYGLFVFGRSSPKEGLYVSELHDKRVRDIGIQDELNSAVTVEGEIFRWRVAQETAVRIEQGGGVSLYSGTEQPYRVEKLFAGTRHSFVLVKMACANHYNILLESDK